MPMQLLGLDHVVLQVADQAAAQKFYTEILGCTVFRVNPQISLVQLRCGEHIIDLIPGKGPGKDPKLGIDHLCISIKCDDVAALAAELREKGVKLDGDEPIARTGAYGRSPSIYLFDPEGYRVELKPR